MSLLRELQKGRLPVSAGNKATNLRWLADHGKQIPVTYVLDWRAYQRYLANDVNLIEELKKELTGQLDPLKPYAIRSSANIEDSLDRSFAGQFKSALNVQGVDAVLQAIWSVWGTAQAGWVNTYLERHKDKNRQIYMAVVIQEMVISRFSGVALSTNPVTGADEVVVEAVPGRGDALVQAGVTPQRWINKWGAWIAKPDSQEVPISLIEQIILETRDIAAKLDAHVDLEWAYDGDSLYWLQVRQITALKQKNIYSSHISKEMLPGIIKPLIGSVNIPLVCTMWIRFMTEIIGKTSVQPEELARLFYYRVYFNMGTLGKLFQEVGLPATSVELMMNALPEGALKPKIVPTFKTFLRIPNTLLFAIQKWFFANKMIKSISGLQSELKTFSYAEAGKLTEVELLGEIDRLYRVVQTAAYYNIVGQLIMGMYARVLKARLRKFGFDFNQFDFEENDNKLAQFDPNTHLDALHAIFTNMDALLQKKIRSMPYASLQAEADLRTFTEGVSAFMERFGHFSDNGNDFSSTPWRETPEMVLGLICDFKPVSARQTQGLHLQDLQVGYLHRRILEILAARAHQFRVLREEVSSLYTFGYGLFRYYYLALGKHLAGSGLIEHGDDIFYLSALQVREAALGIDTRTDFRTMVKKHKEDIDRFRNITLPVVIYGDEPPPLAESSTNKLVGIPSSIGSYTGKTVLVRGIQDFAKVREGDVLVIPYSDVGWTPLFARAGAVIAESGGLLSHSSIVAREYNIPAVVSAEGATRIPDHTLVTVNGHNGEILIHENTTI